MGQPYIPEETVTVIVKARRAGGGWGVTVFDRHETLLADVFEADPVPLEAVVALVAPAVARYVTTDPLHRLLEVPAHGTEGGR